MLPHMWDSTYAWKGPPIAARSTPKQTKLSQQSGGSQSGDDTVHAQHPSSFIDTLSTLYSRIATDMTGYSMTAVLR